MAHLAEALGHRFEAKAYMTLAVAVHPDRQDLRLELTRLESESEATTRTGRTSRSSSRRARSGIDPVTQPRRSCHRLWIDWVPGLAAASVCLAIMIVSEPFLVDRVGRGYTRWAGRQGCVSWFARPAKSGSIRRALAAACRRARAAQPHSCTRSRARWIHAPACSTRRFLPGSGRLPAKNPTGIPRSMPSVGLVGDLLVPTWEALPRARLGPILVFSLTCGAVFSFFRSRWGSWSAVAAAGAWMFQPHLFALAHYATYDGLLTSLWTGCVLSFARAVERTGDRAPSQPAMAAGWPCSVCFTACAMGTKLTGWLLPLPLPCLGRSLPRPARTSGL